jgi:hypothetical protein
MIVLIFLDFFLFELADIYLLESQETLIIDPLLSPLSIFFILSFTIPIMLYRKTLPLERPLLQQISFLISLFFLIGFFINFLLIILKFFSLEILILESLELFDILILVRLIFLLEACFYLILFGKKLEKLELTISGIFYFGFFSVPHIFLFLF